jgi:hypothetical protein
VAPNDKTNFYINGDYGRNAYSVGGGHASWEGIALAGRYQLTKMGALAARAEYFKDAQGFATGTAQSLGEFTITGEYKFSSIFLSRLEARRDISSVPFFNDLSKPNGTSTDTTLTLAFMAVFGPYK